MVLKLQKHRLPVILMLVLVGLFFMANPAQAQLRQKGSKKTGTPPPTPTETDKPAGDSKPVLLNKDTLMQSPTQQESKDSKAIPATNGTAITPGKTDAPKAVVAKPASGPRRKGPNRVEMEANSHNNIFYSIPVGSNVVLIYPVKKGVHSGQQRWTYIGYDSVLNKLYEKDFSIPRNMNLQAYDVTGEKAYLYFAKGKQFGTVSSTVGNFQVLSVTAPSGQISTVAAKLPFNCVVKLIPTPDGVYLAGQSFPTKMQIQSRICWSFCLCYIPICFGSLNVPQYPLIMKVNTSNSTTKIVPINEKGHVNIKSAQYDPNTNITDILISNRINKKEIVYTLRQLDENSNLGNAVTITPKEDKTITGGSIYAAKDGSKYVVGSYGKSLKSGSAISHLLSSISGMAYYEDSRTEGIFMSKITDGKQTAMNLYPYVKLKNFYNFGETDNTNNYEKKVAKRRAAKGKDHITPYRILPHKLFEYNDQIIFIGEAYFPHYHTEYYIDANGHLRSREVFDGWIFTHAVIAGFDKDGNLIWDHSFKIQSTLSFAIKEHVRVLNQGNEMILVYAKGGGVYSQVIAGDDIVEGRSFSKSSMANRDEVVKKDYEIDAAYWYDNNFIVFGRQKIVMDKKNKGASKGRIFYMSKLAYQ